MELQPAVQRYDWGKIGNSSLVAKFAAAGNSAASDESEINQSFTIEADGKYAELWMGSHPNGPATIKGTGELLLDHIKKDPSVLGEKVRARFGDDDIPFLFKVLSVEKALSIQAHPDKAQAKILHETQGELYKDPNHKPEMAIALTPFEMLCGFRQVDQIVQFLKDVPELRDIITEDLATRFAENKDKDSLQAVFTKLMESPSSLIAAKLDQLLSKINDLNAEEQKKIEGDLVIRLSKQFPNDVGIWCVFFLQHFTLEPGQAVFLPANEPHAYIYGDCIECMAASDNVVRAGLTPKFKDVKTLCTMLTYDTGKDWIINGTPFANGTGLSYDPPVEEFAVIRYQCDGAFSLKPHSDSCSILICVEGQGKAVPQSGKRDAARELSPGTVLFIPCKSELSGMQIIPSPKAGPILIYEAYSTPSSEGK